MKNRRFLPLVAAVLALFGGILLLYLPPWVLPPIAAIETGPAAIEMVQFRDQGRNAQPQIVPEPEPAVQQPDDSARAGDVYQNVEVLGDLSVNEFNRLMTAITTWVAPEEGCAFCHNVEEGFADDSYYTYNVSRQMLEMVRDINSNWDVHVAPSGVTCYTCHRGNNVPSYAWYDQEEPGANQFLGKPRPWFLAATTIRQFFPAVPFVKYAGTEGSQSRIQSSTPLVAPDGRPEVANEQTAEDLYLYMMQQSDSLGVNCTYCHNSRAFADWSQSTPYRWIGYHGIQMNKHINIQHLTPLQNIFPDVRKGPLGDVAKVNCMTCHQGLTKPLAGYDLTSSYLQGLTEDGQPLDLSEKEEILRSAGHPVAMQGEFLPPIRQQYAPRAPQRVIQTGRDTPPLVIPVGEDAPAGSLPQYMRPGTSMVVGGHREAALDGVPPANADDAIFDAGVTGEDYKAEPSVIPPASSPVSPDMPQPRGPQQSEATTSVDDQSVSDVPFSEAIEEQPVGQPPSESEQPTLDPSMPTADDAAGTGNPAQSGGNGAGGAAAGQ